MRQQLVHAPNGLIELNKLIQRQICAHKSVTSMSAQVSSYIAAGASNSVELGLLTILSLSACVSAAYAEAASDSARLAHPVLFAVPPLCSNQDS